MGTTTASLEQFVGPIDGDTASAMAQRRPDRLALWALELLDVVNELRDNGDIDPALVRTAQDAVAAKPDTRVVLDPTPPHWEPCSGAVLLASSPRAGNTITRRLIGELGYREHAAHDLADVRFNPGSPPWILQFHALPDEVAPFMTATGAQAVTVVRHPLDVLSSVRAFAARTPAVRYWLGGRADLADRDLSSIGEFRRWAMSPGADAVLDVSTTWAETPGTLVLRHEDLVADLVGAQHQLAESLGHPYGEQPLDAARAEAADSSIAAAHRTSAGPGAWEQWPPSLAVELARRHRHHFEVGNYPVPG